MSSSAPCVLDSTDTSLCDLGHLVWQAILLLQMGSFHCFSCLRNIPWRLACISTPSAPSPQRGTETRVWAEQGRPGALLREEELTGPPHTLGERTQRTPQGPDSKDPRRPTAQVAHPPTHVWSPCKEDLRDNTAKPHEEENSAGRLAWHWSNYRLMAKSLRPGKIVLFCLSFSSRHLSKFLSGHWLIHSDFRGHTWKRIQALLKA